MLIGRQHDLLVLSPTQASPEIYHATLLSSVSALALITWDILLTLDDEIDYIWLGSGRTQVKWIYLVTRWFGLLNQIGIQIWQTIIIAYAPVSMSTCDAFFIFEAVAFQFLQLCLDAVLILRVWAVYQRHFKYISTAIAIVIFETVMMTMTQIISVPKSSVDGTCIVVHTPITTICLGIGVIVSQSALLCLTYCGKVRLQSVARRSKLISIVVRDGVLVFGALIVLMILVYFKFDQVVINVFMPWMPVMPTILTYRTILNMQTAAVAADSTLEFTTDLRTMPNQASTLHELAVVYDPPRDS